MIPKQFRPIPFWSWNEKLECTETKRQCQIMDKAGLGGYFMHARGGLETTYMGEEWFENIETAISCAEESGMGAWIYDENGWPSGFGNGIINGLGEEYQQKYLRMEKGEKETPYTICNHEGYHFFYEVNPFYVDNLDNKVVAAFLKHIYDPYYERFQQRIKGVFTDEPQLSRNGIPWSMVLPQKYQEVYGEELYPNLRMLFDDIGEYQIFRIKFWKLVTNLFVESYTKQIYDWCIEKGWEFTGHFVLEDELKIQITSNGAVMPHYEYFTMPGVDWLGRDIGAGLAAYQVGSAAQQLGKKQVLSESFAMCGHNVSFDELRRIAEWQMVRGVNLFCPHLEGYSLRGIRKRDYPPAMYYQQPWWDEYSRFIDEISRVGMILSEGEAACDTLLIHPQTTAWACFNNGKNGELDDLEKRFLCEMKTLERKHILFHLGDELIIEKHGSVSGDIFLVGKQNYKRVIVLNNTILLEGTKQLLEEFQKNGGIVSTAEELEASLVIDNEEIIFTKRIHDGREIYYFVNSTQQWQKTNFAIGTQKMDVPTGEWTPFNRIHEFPPYSSLLVMENGISAISNREIINELDVMGEWELTGCIENVVPLDVCDVYFDDVLVEKDCPILDAHTKACELNKEVFIQCIYHQEFRYIPQELYLVCETPEKFQISVNGNKISYEDRGFYFDKAFRKIDISKHIKLGENVILLECNFVQSNEVYEAIQKAKIFEAEKNKLYYDMELEPIYLVGDFGVYGTDTGEVLDKTAWRVSKDFYIDKKPEVIKLSHIEKQGYLFFSGQLVVEKEIIVDKKDYNLILDKKGINAVNVFVNDRFAGTSIYNHEKIDLSEYLMLGKNQIRLVLKNNLRNLLGPHHLDEGESYSVGPHSFYRDSCVWNMGIEQPWSNDYCVVEQSVRSSMIGTIKEQ